jgi:hypothetical protein
VIVAAKLGALTNYNRGYFFEVTSKGDLVKNEALSDSLMSVNSVKEAKKTLRCLK